MHIYYSFPAPLLLLPFIPPTLPVAAAAQSLSLCSILPCWPSSVPGPTASIRSAPVPTTTTFAVQSASHLHSHPVLFFISLHSGGEINLLYTCHFLQNFDLLCLQPLTSFPSLPPAWTVNTPVWYIFFLPWYKTRVGVCFKFSLISSISKHPVRSSAARADGLIPPGGLRHSMRSEGAAQGAQLRAHPITLQGRLASGSRCIYIHSSCSSLMSSASHLHDPEVGRVPASFPAPNPLTVCSSQYDNTEQAGARRGSKKPHRQH